MTVASNYEMTIIDYYTKEKNYEKKHKPCCNIKILTYGIWLTAAVFTRYCICPRHIYEQYANAREHKTGTQRSS